MTRYTLSMRIVLVTAFWNNVVITIVIKMVEMVEILDGRLGKLSVERVRYVINNLLHLVFVKYGDISLVLCISTRLRLVTILSQLVKYLVILHANPCNTSYIWTDPITLPCSLARVGSKGQQLYTKFSGTTINGNTTYDCQNEEILQ